MTQTSVAFIRCIIDSMWTLATGWYLPGLGFTPAAWILFLILFGIVLRTVISILTVEAPHFMDTSAPSMESKFADADRAYEEALRGYWERRRP